MGDTKTDLAALIEAALDEWTGCTWSEEYVVGSDCRVVIEPSETWFTNELHIRRQVVRHIRRGGEGCLDGVEAAADEATEYAEKVAKDAEDANCLARQALALLQEGEVNLAATKIDMARDLEVEYGDAPTWGAVAASFDAYFGLGESR